MSLMVGHLLPPTSKHSFTKTSHCLQNPKASLQSSAPKPTILPSLLSLALSVTLSSPFPVLAIPSLNSQSSLVPPPTTPFSQSKNLQTGLENGMYLLEGMEKLEVFSSSALCNVQCALPCLLSMTCVCIPSICRKIRPCPSINPGCVSTNPRSSSFAFPLTIPANSSDNAIQRLKEAILETQKNAKIQILQDTPDGGQYLQAEFDGGFGRDVLEFLVKGDLVSYRCMATKVTYLYPFTTALGNSKGQEERMKKITDQLGWYAPSFEAMD